VFWGSHDHVLDEKGRTSLPKDFREALAQVEGDAWITAYPQCLAIVPGPAFEELRKKLTGDGSHVDSIQRLRRMILGMAIRCSFDKQGRILIPPKLRRWANLARDVVFTGVGDHIEIWDQTTHERELEETRHNYPEYSRDLRETRT